MREHLELSPVRPMLVGRGWFLLLSHAAGVLIALPFVRRPALTIGLFGADALVFGLLSLFTWRYALKRVVVPPPPDAVIVAERFAMRQLISTVLTLGIVALAVMQQIPPAILGLGVGTACGLLWNARKIKQFEGDDGRQVLRRVGQRPRGAPYLYAGP